MNSFIRVVLFFSACLLNDSLRNPPDVPPRNPGTMSRLNGRLKGSGQGSNAGTMVHLTGEHQHPMDLEFEPSNCVIRTASGSVYIQPGKE